MQLEASSPNVEVFLFGNLKGTAYTRGDPINRADPGGNDDCDPSDCIALYGYCPPEYQVCYDGSSYTDGALSAGSSNPCNTQSALFNPSAAVIGCMQYYTAIETFAPALPSCTIEVYNRQIDATRGINVLFAQHGFIELLLPDGTYFAEGNKKGNLLTAYAGPAGGQAPSDTTSPANLDGILTSPAVCGWLSILEGDASKVNLAKIPYHWYGPNSSSVLAYMLNSLPNTSWFNLPFLVGYTTPLPFKP